MAKQLSKTGIETGLDIEAHHVTQSVDAFTGIDAYDVTLSGSLTHTGSIDVEGTLIMTSSVLSGFHYLFINEHNVFFSAPQQMRMYNFADGFPNSPYRFNVSVFNSEASLASTAMVSPNLGKTTNIVINPTEFRVATGSSSTLYLGESNTYGKMPHIKLLQTVDTAGTLPTNNSIQSTGSWEHTGSATFVNSITGSSMFATLYGPNQMQLLSEGAIELKSQNNVGIGNIILNSSNHVGIQVTTGSGYIDFTDYDGGGNSFQIYPYQAATTMSANNQSLLVEAAGDIELDASGDITLSADGDQITMDDGTTTRFTFNLDSTPELDVTGDFTIDSSGDIFLDADGGDIGLKDGGITVYKFDLSAKNIELGSNLGNQTISIYGTTPSPTNITGNSIVLQGGQGGSISGNGGGVTIQGGTGNGTGDGGDIAITGGNKTGGFGTKQGDVFIGSGGNTDMMIVSASNDIYFTEDVNVEGSSLWVGPTQGGITELGLYAVSGEPGGTDSKVAALLREGGGAPNDGIGRLVLYNTGSSKIANIVAQIGGGGDSFLGSGGGLAIGSSYQYVANITNELLQLDADSARQPTSPDWLYTSDERLKENIITASLDICYDRVKNIPLKYFGYKEEFTKEPLYDQHKLGWLAQDVEASFPKAITTSSFTTWSTYTGSVPITGSAIGPEGETSTLYPGERYQDVLAGSTIISDRKSIDQEQLMKTLYGAVQKLQQKVEALEAQISGSN
jgi:hypothetical protein